MEDNNDMTSASTLETQSLGETDGEDLAAIFRDDDSNDITQGDSSSKSEVQKQSTLSFFSQSDTHSCAVWLMYLVIV